METATDSIKAAVEAQCSGDGAIPANGEENLCIINHCAACQGTGLKYPSLSRMEMQYRVGAVRIPDVTLEKISYLPHIYRVAINLGSPGKGAPRTGDEFYCEITYMSPVDPGVMKYYSGQGSTPLLAACAALMAST